MAENAMIGCNQTTTRATASTTWYAPFNAIGPMESANTTESNAKSVFRCGVCTLSNLYVRCNTNTRAQPSIVVVRQDTGGGSANTTLTISTTGSTTGTYSDATHTVSVADTDYIDLACTNGTGTGNMTFCGITCNVQAAGQVAIQMAGMGSYSSTSQTYFPICTNNTQNGGETSATNQALQNLTISHMQELVTTNGGTGWSVESRNNGGTGAQSITVGAAATGLFEDAVNSDSVTLGHTFGQLTHSCTVSRTIVLCSMKYSGAADTCRAVGAFISLTSASTKFSPLWYASVATESNNYSPMAIAATMSMLTAELSANASSAGATMILRGGASGGSTLTQTVALGTGTGFVQDATHTDSVNVGDLLNYQASGSNATITINNGYMLITGSGAPVSSGFHGLAAIGAGK